LHAGKVSSGILAIPTDGFLFARVVAEAMDLEDWATTVGARWLTLHTVLSGTALAAGF
jgi:hypothetical protein